jgi:CheY-like chemotaxis protein
MRTLRMLVAEDTSTNQIVIRAVLRKLGFNADVVGNGEQALNALDGKEYDIVLMDIHMPVMDGITAIRKLRASRQNPNSQIPVIALSASILKEECSQYLAAGMNDVLGKPIEIEKVQAMLEKWTSYSATK